MLMFVIIALLPLYGSLSYVVSQVTPATVAAWQVEKAEEAERTRVFRCTVMAKLQEKDALTCLK